MHFALNHAARARRLVVVDMAPRAYEPRFARLLHALREVEPGRFRSRKEADLALGDITRDEAVRQLLLKNLAPDGEGGYRWRVNVDSLARHNERLREAVRGPAPFTGPTLFLLGGKSDYVGEADRPGIRELFPRAQFESIPDAGHWVHAEKPEEFAGAVLRFLESRE
jgi:pimeloyl-ACP methyl ester carboxylesterase